MTPAPGATPPPAPSVDDLALAAVMEDGGYRAAKLEFEWLPRPDARELRRWRPAAREHYAAVLARLEGVFAERATRDQAHYRRHWERYGPLVNSVEAQEGLSEAGRYAHRAAIMRREVAAVEAARRARQRAGRSGRRKR